MKTTSLWKQQYEEILIHFRIFIISQIDSFLKIPTLFIMYYRRVNNVVFLKRKGGKNAIKQKRSKIIMAILIFLSVANLIGILIFRLPEVSVEWARLIYDNPITNKVYYAYWNINFYLISIPIIFANFLCAAKGLRLVYKEKTSAHKRIIGYWIYTIISSGVLAIHCYTFYYVVKCIIMSVWIISYYWSTKEEIAAWKSTYHWFLWR